MSIIQAIAEIFDSIFKRSSPEVQKRMLLKKLDSEIRLFTPVLCVEGKLQPNFAEALYSLYKLTRSFDDLFSVTVSPLDVQRQHRFESQLIFTAYSSEDQAIFEALSYENRKREILESNEPAEKIYYKQRKNFDKLIRDLNDEPFEKMDMEILELRHFVEFCHYSFVPFMQIFDNGFIAGDFSYKPTYTEVSVHKAINLLEDFYYLTEGLKITTVLADQVLALAQLRKGVALENTEINSYVGNLKKINYIISKIIPANRIKALIRYVKADGTYEPKIALYSGSPRKEFAAILKTEFDSNELRVKSEIQDEQISSDVTELFKNVPLEQLFGYNDEYNRIFQKNTSFAFKWIKPMQVLKTFVKVYISSGIKSLLNDIVIEGFFSSPTYKSNFSGTVYSVINADSQISEFEDSFGQDKRNSIAVMQGYVHDSHKDKDFYRRLEKMVVSANDECHKIMQEICTALEVLYKNLIELIADAKKPSSEIISNLKMLMMSSRNREHSNLLEEQIQNWTIFFDIMKNYVIINNVNGDV